MVGAADQLVVQLAPDPVQLLGPVDEQIASFEDLIGLDRVQIEDLPGARVHDQVAAYFRRHDQSPS